MLRSYPSMTVPPSLRQRVKVENRQGNKSGSQRCWMYSLLVPMWTLLRPGVFLTSCPFKFRMFCRYWARSTFGWDSFSQAKPNTAHVALARLEAAGKIDGVITQASMPSTRRINKRKVEDVPRIETNGNITFRKLCSTILSLHACEKQTNDG